MDLRYFDTSVILSMLFSDQNAERALELWDGNFARVSSSLLSLECYVNFHKFTSLVPEKLRSGWRRSGSDWLKKVLSQFYLHEIDEEIRSKIATSEVYGRCRTLDAIHLATAGTFARETDDFSIATFDSRMKAAAEGMGFKVVF
ncbi:MAG: type II toxin-antitoxin system VapC family toxin [SAR324 cluster bacterium]|uniref:Type II toxin-antitoxin system VapC family toxin n=1 Tax=SAR324 cluster bacterium TaxID=2024889 RepID=A0A7X9FST9_9DELT|nr:type II toxin-antitoxin system VapC family toxin [SAR324 cluster bacterium]